MCQALKFEVHCTPTNCISIEDTHVGTVDDQLIGDQINGFDQINGQKGYDDQLYVVINGFLTNYLTDLTFGGFSYDMTN